MEEKIMILADKIIYLRKKNGWSQEELAEKLGVTRQSVSKWEGAQSVPDLERILQIGKVFGVSTDYLLKDDMETEESVSESYSDDDGSLRKVSMEEANRFLRINEKRAPRTAFGVSLCILSPIVLIILAGLSDYRPDFFGSFTISENIAGGIGVAVLLAIIAFAVIIFIMSGRELKDFEFLENEGIDTNYGVSGMAKERREAYSSKHTKNLILGTVIFILSVIPLFLSAITDDDLTAIMGVALLLAICSVGAYILVKTSIIIVGYNMLLDEDDYSRERKSDKKNRRDIMVIYWLIVTAVYIGYIWYARAHFWDNSGWGKASTNGLVIWVVAGLLCPVVSRIVKMIRK